MNRYQSAFVTVALACLLVQDARAQQVIPVQGLNRSSLVSFDREVLPILRKKCITCHSQSEADGELNLETPAAMIKGGDSGPALIARNGNDSLLLEVASHRDDPKMPPPGNDVGAVNLTAQELGLLKLWIDQGAQGSGGTSVLSPQSWRPLPKGLNPIYAVAVSPDGQYAACGRANQIFIYHVATGQLVTRLTDPSLIKEGEDDRPGIAHLDVVQSLAFNNQGDMLASGGFRVAKLWRRPRDVQRHKFAAADTVTAVAVNPDGTVAATGAADNLIKLWNVETGEEIAALEGHTAAVSSLKFSDDGSQLVSSSLDKTIRVWNPIDGQLLGRIDTSSEVNAVTLVNESIPQKDEEGNDIDPLTVTHIATGGTDNFIRLWRMPTELSETLAQMPEKTNVLAVSPVRKLLALANAAGQVSVIDFETREVVKSWKAHEVEITSLAFRPLPKPAEAAEGEDAEPAPVVRQLATASADNTIRIWNLDTGEPLDVIYGSLVVPQSIAFSPDGKSLLSGATDGTVSIWNLEAPTPVDLATETTGVAAVSAISPDGKLLATTGEINKRPAIVVRDVATSETKHLFLGHLAPITSLAFSVDNTKLVSGSTDKTARVWSVAGGKFPEVATFAGHEQAVSAVAFNANGAQVLSGSTDGVLKLWNVVGETEAMAFAGHTGAIVAVAMPPNNQPISASADKTVRVWNPADGKQLRAITAPAAVTAMSVTREGARVAVASTDNKVHLHQVSDAKLLLSLEGHTAAIKTVAFSADNSRLVTGGADNRAVVWTSADGRLLEILPLESDLATAIYGPDLTSVFLSDAKGGLARQSLRFALALPGFTKPISKVAWHPTAALAYATGEEGVVRGYNTTNASLTFTANHGAPIHDLAIAPSGAQFATAGEDKLIKTFTATNGAPVAPTQLTGFTGPVKGVCYSADSTRVIGSGDVAIGELFVFSLANVGELEQSLVGHAASIAAVATIGDADERLISISADQSVRAWQLLAIRRVAGHSQPINSLATVTTAPMQILSGSNDGTVRHWNMTTGAAIRNMNHGAPVTAVAVRPDGQRFASTSENKTVRLWNAANGAQVALMSGDIQAKNLVAKLTQQQTDATARLTASTAAAKAAVDGLPAKQTAAKTVMDQLTAANADVQAKMTTLTQATATKAAAEQAAIQAAAVAQKAENTKLTATQAATESEAFARVAMDKFTRAQAAATAKPEDATLAAAAKASQDALNVANEKMAAAKAAVATPTQQATSTSAAAAAAAQRATATNKPFTDALAALRASQNTQNQRAQANVFAQRDLKEATEAIPATKAIQTADEAALEKIKTDLEAAKAAELAAQMPLRTLAFSPDNRQLATGGDFNVVHTWNAENGVAVTSYVGHTGPIQTLAYVSNEELLTGSVDKSAAVWDLNPGWMLERTIGSVDDPSKLVNRVVAVDFSNDGELLATGGGIPSRSGEIKIWKIADGSQVHAILDAHTDAVFGVDFSRDGRYIATAGADKYVRSFDVATGKQVHKFEGHTNHVLGVTWRANGKMLASCGAEGAINIWNAETGDRIRNIATFRKQVSSVQFVGDTNIIATCSADRILRMHNADNGGVVRNFNGTGEDFLYSVDVTPNSTVLVAGGYDSVLRIWRGTAANSQPIQAIEPPKDPAEEEVTQGTAPGNQQAAN